MEVLLIGIVVIVVGVIAMSGLTCVGLSKVKAEHEKEKARKLAMMQEYPELAEKIWQSIEDQDARLDARMKNFGDGIKKAGADFKNAVTPTPRPKSQAGRKAAAAAVRTGLIIARKLAK